MSLECSSSKKPGACVFQEFADSVSQLVTQKFRELTVGLTSSVHARHRALAGIVMTKGNASSFSCGNLITTTGKLVFAWSGNQRILPSSQRHAKASRNRKDTGRSVTSV